MVVIADMLFTASAVVLQPVTGGLLMLQTSMSLSDHWLAPALVPIPGFALAVVGFVRVVRLLLRGGLRGGDQLREHVRRRGRAFGADLVWVTMREHSRREERAGRGDVTPP